jgi:hypothetical protein
MQHLDVSGVSLTRHEARLTSVGRVRHEPALATRFFDEFFGLEPSAREAIGHLPPVERHEWLVRCLARTLQLADDVPPSQEEARRIHEQHDRYGVADAHLAAFKSGCLSALEQSASKPWSDGTAAQWSEAIDRAIAIVADSEERIIQPEA